MRNPKDILINGKQLSKILENHKKWLLSEKGGERANLYSADLSYANLSSADLSSADLRYANLRSADLSYANLHSANLRYANLYSAENAEIAIAMTYIAPESGAFVGYKKCNDNIVVKLQIPARAKRSNATGRKCRAEYVKVLAVYGGDVGVTNYYGPRTEYKKGKTVRCDKWNDDRWNECSGGIHFFMTRTEAESW